MQLKVVSDIRSALIEAVAAADAAGESLLALRLAEALDCAKDRLQQINEDRGQARPA